MEDYKEKYEQALERARVVNPGTKDYNIVTTIFPELKESKDEGIRKAIIRYLNREITLSNFGGDIAIFKEWIAWLEKQSELVEEYEDKLDRMCCESFDKGYKAAIEKQGEQRSNDKVEPKFKVGDWITDGTSTFQIINIDDEYYFADDGDHVCFNVVHQYYHLWTIKDAKDGDVLYTSSTASHEIFIFKGLSKEGNIECYCSYDSEDKYCEGKYHFIGKPTFMTHPATKEQCDLLFSKMKEVGYEWDNEKKELREVEIESIEIPMTLDEAIEHCKEKSCGNSTCASQHKQLAQWLTELKEYKEQNSAWSENDEQIFNSIINVLEATPSAGFVPIKREIMIPWLKSFKGRVQPKQEWSEEDEVCYTSIVEHLKYSITNGKPETYKSGRLTDWLKVLKERCTWKPSDKQMKALNYVVNLMASSESPTENDYYYNVFKAMRTQLKKLREE